MAETRVVISGFGNVGRGVVESLKRNNDMILAGILSRNPERVKREVSDVPVMDVNDSSAWLEVLKPDVVILCGGSKNDLPEWGPKMAALVNTVDSFDNHSKVPEYFQAMDEAASKSGHVSVISTGWDPGIFSLERVLAGAFIPGAPSAKRGTSRFRECYTAYGGPARRPCVCSRGHRAQGSRRLPHTRRRAHGRADAPPRRSVAVRGRWSSAPRRARLKHTCCAGGCSASEDRYQDTSHAPPQET